MKAAYYCKGAFGMVVFRVPKTGERIVVRDHTIVGFAEHAVGEGAEPVAQLLLENGATRLVQGSAADLIRQFFGADIDTPHEAQSWDEAEPPIPYGVRARRRRKYAAFNMETALEFIDRFMKNPKKAGEWFAKLLDKASPEALERYATVNGVPPRAEGESALAFARRSVLVSMQKTIDEAFPEASAAN